MGQLGSRGRHFGLLETASKRRNQSRVAHLGHRGLGQQNTADALGGSDDLLDQHAVEQGNQTLGHLGFVRAVRSEVRVSPQIEKKPPLVDICDFYKTC